MPRRSARRVPGGVHDTATGGPRAERALRQQALGGDWMPLAWLSCNGHPCKCTTGSLPRRHRLSAPELQRAGDRGRSRCLVKLLANCPARPWTLPQPATG
eukprot:13852022-Alexandrium_andersonii.AAC.1